MSGKVVSTGRGGAGNIGTSTDKAKTAADFTTPTIKSEHYTTGRGGTGNMALNLAAAPEMARASQDVDTPPHRSHGQQVHVGRGGEGNVFREKPAKGKKIETSPTTTATTTATTAEKEDGVVVPQDEGAVVPDGAKRQARKGSMGQDLADKGRELLRRMKSGGGH